MKKISFNYHNWKKKKKYSFRFYFVLFTMLVFVVALSISSIVIEVLKASLKEIINIPDYVVIISISLIVGLILSIFIGKGLIFPIKNLKNKMNEVANGNLNIRINENSIFDEVEDINHYFNLMLDELRATEIIQTDFISNVSHEFKTPLNAIDGYATLLSDTSLTDKEKEEYINKIHFNAKRMNELILNILLLSKLDNQAINFKKNSYSLDEQIRQSILYLEPKWQEKNIEFDLNLDIVNFKGNEGLMNHVWNNLIDNAIKFGPYNSTIKISLKKMNENIEFIIEDQGPGIPKDKEKFIFNKFYQSDTSHKSEGNGLGLALVKKILDVHNSSIEVNHLEPCGCQFKILLIDNK